MSIDDREILIGRRFEVSKYSSSHSVLFLRSSIEFGYERRVSVLLKGVRKIFLKVDFICENFETIRMNDGSVKFSFDKKGDNSVCASSAFVAVDDLPYDGDLDIFSGRTDWRPIGAE